LPTPLNRLAEIRSRPLVDSLVLLFTILLTGFYIADRFLDHLFADPPDISPLRGTAGAQETIKGEPVYRLKQSSCLTRVVTCLELPSAGDGPTRGKVSRNRVHRGGRCILYWLDTCSQ